MSAQPLGSVVMRDAAKAAGRLARSGVAPLVMPELDERDREEQRYAIYEGRREIISTPTLEGVGGMIKLLRTEKQIDDDTRIGLLDRVERTWLLNPWAKGRL